MYVFLMPKIKPIKVINLPEKLTHTMAGIQELALRSRTREARTKV